MRTTLAFEPTTHLSDGRTLYRPRLIPRSSLPLKLACDVTNATIDRIAALLRCEVSAELIEPIALDPTLQALLLDGAHIVRAKGERTDAFIVIDRQEGSRLARYIFGASEPSGAVPLSSIESSAIEQLSGVVALACAPLCGRLGTLTQESPRCAAVEAQNYFEIQFTRPIRFTIGVGATGEPDLSTSACPAIEQFRGVPMSARVRLGRARVTVSELAKLRIGSVVPLDVQLDESLMRVGNTVIARGFAGIKDGRYALRLAATAAPTAA
ncbi:MAG: FliM/FliN family flagellar motor switch protein [Candidatus Eremiobacteraeota bacterium]|nr:FliM/FliN family flagellar motor switch protein [Candidatus Eremiobacteraeota bacterium]